MTNENKKKKIEKCEYSHIHFDGTTSCVEAGWEDDKVTKTDESRCEACEKYKSRYIEYPITVNKIDVKPIEYDSWHCKAGDHVWAKQPKELAGRTGYVKAFDEYKQEYFVTYGKEVWIVPAADLEMVDPATEQICSPVYEPETDDDTPLPEEPCGNIDIKEAVDAMYYHTKKANQVWWVMLGVVAVAVVLGLTGVGAALLAVASLVAALMQNLWQGVTLEWFVRRLYADGCSKFDSYPSFISNGGWAFYAVKMILALSALVAMVVGFE